MNAEHLVARETTRAFADDPKFKCTPTEQHPAEEPRLFTASGDAHTTCAAQASIHVNLTGILTTHRSDITVMLAPSGSISVATRNITQCVTRCAAFRSSIRLTPITQQSKHMDLVTLVAACALTVDPKIMHALIWHQSGGEPWSFTVPGERHPQVYRTASDTVSALRSVYPDDITVRVGLTGLKATPRSATTEMFAPCSNIAIAAHQFAQLAERCAVSPPVNGPPVYCAIAAWHGSWEHPDSTFAKAVRTSVVNGYAPDFEMPANTKIDVAGDVSTVRAHDVTATPLPASDDRERAWSSALFPEKSRLFDRPTTSGSASGHAAADVQKSDTSNTRPATARPHADGLFVPRSTQRNSP